MNCVVCVIQSEAATAALKQCLLSKETCAVVLLLNFLNHDQGTEGNSCWADCWKQQEGKTNKKEADTVKTYGSIFLGATAAAMAAPVVVGTVVGVTAAGPVAGGLFAAAQAIVGGVAAGGTLAAVQGFVMGGVTATAGAATGATAAALYAAYDYVSGGSNAEEDSDLGRVEGITCPQLPSGLDTSSSPPPEDEEDDETRTTVQESVTQVE